MADIVKRVPKSLRGTFWIKIDDEEIYNSKTLNKANNKILRDLEIEEYFQELIEHIDNSVDIVSLTRDCKVIMSSYPKDSLILLEIISLRDIASSRIDRTIKSIFDNLNWIKYEYH
jgi:hypothetical protein